MTPAGHRKPEVSEEDLGLWCGTALRRTLLAEHKEVRIVTETKQAWREVADQFAGLGSKLKLHLEQPTQRESDDTVKKALEDLRESLDHTFSTIGRAVKDPSVKQDVIDVARSLREALSTTFTEASDDLRNCFTHRPGGPGS